MFSTATRNTYSDNLAGTRDNLLDILKRAGLNTLWVDNNSGCKDVCKNIRTIEVKTEKSAWCGGNYCFDEILLTNLQKYINEMDGKDSVIVLHLIGSHGPNYYKRYPEKHRYFSPDCKSVDLQSCTNEALINSYDNTILYTDFVLTNIIKILESNSASWNSFMMYISDHGESLGEYGIYLHGAPYSVAPIEQIKVPYIVWLSTQFLKVKNIDIECLSNKAKENNYSHDNLFHSVLGIMDIKTKIYEEEMDVFKSCRKS